MTDPETEAARAWVNRPDSPVFTHDELDMDDLEAAFLAGVEWHRAEHGA